MERSATLLEEGLYQVDERSVRFNFDRWKLANLKDKKSGNSR